MAQQRTFITGTRKGIGKFLVHHYVKQGHIVFGCSREDVDWKLDGYEHFIADVSDEAAIKDAFQTIRRKHDGIDNLINNAGIASMNHSLLTTISTVRNILNTNVIGTFLLCREAAKLMQRQNFGRIVNFATVATPLRLEGEAIYAASKSAINSLTQILACELAPYGITVNAVGPTPVETDLIRSVPKEKIERLLKRQAIPRLGVGEDIANVTDFFLRRESDFVTGQILYLGGV